MNIVFICGSLEPGRDGVGDYTRRLAAELQQQGHTASCIALNDHFIEEPKSGQQSTDSVRVSVLRIPFCLPTAQQDALAKEWIDAINPTWLSLQFVSFSFSTRGLPFGLGKRLSVLGRGRKWHFMAHELWVAMAISSSRKHLAWSFVQRFVIKHLIARLKPQVIHTQLELYQLHLAKLGFKSRHLPLFSNIQQIENKSPAIGSELLFQPISLVVFGTIHPGAPIAKFAQDSAHYSERNNRAVRLIFVGRCGAEQDKWAEIWKRAGMPVEILGEQAPEKISDVLYNGTIGITTTPIPLIGKSGTVAAMLEHGLPVLCISEPWHPRGIAKTFTPPSGINHYIPGHFEEYLVAKIPIKAERKIHTVGLQFSRDLLN